MVYATLVTWLWCGPMAIYTREANCWKPQVPENCEIGHPIFLQLYDESDPSQCTVQSRPPGNQ